MPQVSAGLVYLKPRVRRLYTPRCAGGNRGMSIAVVVIGTMATAGYYLWQRHEEMTNPLHIAVATHPISKLSVPATVPTPAAPPAGGDLLARAQLENELLYTDLQSFVCNEHIQRYKGGTDSDNGKQLDTVTARVSFESGVERYSDIHQNDKQRASMANLRGAWSEGEFGTLLRQTHALLGTAPVTLKGESNVNDQPAAVYTITVGEGESPWDLVSGGRSYKIPFRTDVSVAKATGQILKIERTSTSMPPALGISQLRWSVTLEPVDLDGKSWLLPKTGEYEVQYANSSHREWNVMTFSDYQRYGSRVILHF